MSRRFGFLALGLLLPDWRLVYAQTPRTPPDSTKTLGRAPTIPTSTRSSASSPPGANTKRAWKRCDPTTSRLATWNAPAGRRTNCFSSIASSSSRSPGIGRTAADVAGVVQHPRSQRNVQAGDDLQGQRLGHRLHRTTNVAPNCCFKSCFPIILKATRSATRPINSATFMRARRIGNTTARLTISSAVFSGIPRRNLTLVSARRGSTNAALASAITLSTFTARSSTAKPIRNGSKRPRSVLPISARRSDAIIPLAAGADYRIGFPGHAFDGRWNSDKDV